MKDGKFLTMAIESSCDETAIAVVADGRTVLSNVISSQIDIFKQYGGVVPEIASRHHLENINGVLQQALDEAGVSLAEIDLIGVTYGPGLIGALLVGCIVAFVVSILAIRFLMDYVKKHTFTAFGWYRIALGIVVLGVWALQTFVLV